MGHVAGQVDGPIDLGDDPAAVEVGARAVGVHGEVIHLEHILGVTTVAGQQHATAAMGIGQLAAHLAEVGGLQIFALVNTYTPHSAAKNRPNNNIRPRVQVG